MGDERENMVFGVGIISSRVGDSDRYLRFFVFVIRVSIRIIVFGSVGRKSFLMGYIDFGVGSIGDIFESSIFRINNSIESSDGNFYLDGNWFF